jgi:hypothetical protein
MKAYGGISRHISFTPRALYFRVKSPLYPLNKRQGGRQSQSGGFGGDINILPLPGIEPRFLDRPARSLIIVPTALPRSLWPVRYRKEYYYIYDGVKIGSSHAFIPVYVLTITAYR